MMTDNSYAREDIASGRSRSENRNLFSLFEARVLDPDKMLIEEPGRRTPRLCRYRGAVRPVSEYACRPWGEAR